MWGAPRKESRCIYPRQISSQKVKSKKSKEKKKKKRSWRSHVAANVWILASTGHPEPSLSRSVGCGRVPPFWVDCNQNQHIIGIAGMSENLLHKACAFVLRLESSCLNTTKNHTLWCCASALYSKLNLGTFNNSADKNMHFADWLPDEQPKGKAAALRNLDSQLARLVSQIFICTFDMSSGTNAGMIEHLLGNWRFRRASAPFAQERHICPGGFDPCPSLWPHRPRGKASAWYRTAYQG